MTTEEYEKMYAKKIGANEEHFITLERMHELMLSKKSVEVPRTDGNGFHSVSFSTPGVSANDDYKMQAVQIAAIMILADEDGNATLNDEAFFNLCEMLYFYSMCCKMHDLDGIGTENGKDENGFRRFLYTQKDAEWIKRVLGKNGYKAP